MDDLNPTAALLSLKTTKLFIHCRFTKKVIQYLPLKTKCFALPTLINRQPGIPRAAADATRYRRAQISSVKPCSHNHQTQLPAVATDELHTCTYDMPFGDHFSTRVQRSLSLSSHTTVTPLCSTRDEQTAPIRTRRATRSSQRKVNPNNRASTSRASFHKQQRISSTNTYWYGTLPATQVTGKIAITLLQATVAAAPAYQLSATLHCLAHTRD